MTINDLSCRLDLEVVQADYVGRPIPGGYTSDLPSAVMAKAASDGEPVTIQAHRNTAAVASLVGIALFRTELTQFQVSGRLYAELGG